MQIRSLDHENFAYKNCTYEVFSWINALYNFLFIIFFFVIESNLSDLISNSTKISELNLTWNQFVYNRFTTVCSFYMFVSFASLLGVLESDVNQIINFERPKYLSIKIELNIILIVI